MIRDFYQSNTTEDDDDDDTDSLPQQSNKVSREPLELALKLECNSTSDASEYAV